LCSQIRVNSHQLAPSVVSVPCFGAQFIVPHAHSSPFNLAMIARQVIPGLARRI
jgi:hypothetical protein